MKVTTRGLQPGSEGALVARWARKRNDTIRHSYRMGLLSELLGLAYIELGEEISPLLKRRIVSAMLGPRSDYVGMTKKTRRKEVLRNRRRYDAKYYNTNKDDINAKRTVRRKHLSALRAANAEAVRSATVTQAG